MNREELISKIISKKEFSELPKKDVEKVLDKFDNDRFVDSEKVKMARDLLRKMYTVFVSNKLLNIKDKNKEWVLKKHMSTRERFDFYKKLYNKLLRDFENPIIFDLGCGVNSFSYEFFSKKVSYVGVEAVRQLVDFSNYYLQKNKFDGIVYHESLFDYKKVKKIIKIKEGPKIVFLFKALDSLEMLDRDYSKKLLSEIVPLVDRVVVSFATRSLVSGKRFDVKRYWFENFVKKEFDILEDFELGNERYIVFESKN